MERKYGQARNAAWAGVLIAILGVLSWNTYGFFVCGLGAIVFGFYARPFAPHEAMADLAAGGMVLGVLGLRHIGLL